MATLISPCGELEDVGSGQLQLTQHIAPIAYSDVGVLKRIEYDWEETGNPTYPVAVFATQIWPELPGALAGAALLMLAARRSGGLWSSLFVAVAAVAVKTRLGLLTLPVAAAACGDGS